jgi:hypothetical protein
MTPEEQASLDAAQEKQIRDLASQITQMSKLGFDPMTVRKGVIAGVADATTPPTVSINISGDTATLVSQVRTLNNYTPLVGQTVLVGKQGTEIFILGSIASVSPTTTADASTSDNGWRKAVLTNGTHAGANNDVYYRRVLDHGAWKMQWRGIWNPAGTTAMIDTANALDTDYRPAAYKPIACARTADGLSTVRVDFNANGTVNLYTATPGIANASLSADISVGGSTDVRLSGYLSQAGSDLGHSHTWGDSDSDDVSHSHGGTTTVAAPTWVSLNGVEYFL